MSFTGKKTPLQLNVESGFSSNQGLRINPTASAWQGVWTADTPYKTPTTLAYSQGQLTSSTVLNKLTAALPNFYNLTPGTLCVTVWRNLLKIGRPDNNPLINCPALGNSRPDTFKTSYAGFGSFKANTSIDEFYNTKSSPNFSLVESVYPPKNYPVDGSWSYVHKNWSSLQPTPGWPTDCTQTTFSPYTDVNNYYHPYAWITGWPGRNPWQEKTAGNPQVAEDPVANSDTYAAAYYPRPDLAPVQPWRSRDAGKIEYDEYFSNGFVATVARQAYYEFWSSYINRRTNQYPEFIKSFQEYVNYRDGANKNINSFSNTTTFVKGNYSNINDLTSSDFAGVNLAFKEFGNDMIRLGKSLDLSNIHQFGLPSKFLLTLQSCNALTESLKLALLYSELSVNELSDILTPTYTPSITQEKKIYNALGLIQGQDLINIRVIINCATSGLNSLADLINPQKMFPNSYRSLTIPEYSTATTSSKIYDFIYLGNGVNTRIRNWGDYLAGILPPDLALACGAFMMTMNQVKNIRQMECEKVSQVVANLEVTNKDLPLINSLDGVPGSVELAKQELALIALGSGEAGTYRFCDFLGAMSGQPYVEYYTNIQKQIEKLQTATLASIYDQLYQYSVTGIFTSAQIQALIDAANAEIASIQASNPRGVEELNYWWNKVGTQMWIEQRAIPYGITRGEAIYTDAGSTDIDAFIRSLEQYALDTGVGAVADVLEAISDTTNIGGQSIVGSLREARNSKRLLNTGGELDNDVADTQPCPCPADAIIDGDVLTAISLAGLPTGYPVGQPPNITILPQGGVFGVGVNTQTAFNIGTICKFVADTTLYPGIINVKPGWITGIGMVSTATLVGPNYEIEVNGACFEPNTSYTFTSQILPAGQNASAQAVLDNEGNIVRINITDGGQGYATPPTVLVDCPPPPVRLGGPLVPGSFAGSPYTGEDPVPDNLVTGDGASYTVDEAIGTVTECNCDCWNA